MTKPALRDTVACCLESPTAFARVKRAVEAVGAIATPVNWQLLVRPCGKPSWWAAVVYEIRPQETGVINLISAFQEWHPGTPILLYTPMMPAAGRVLEQLVGREGVYVYLEPGCNGQIETLKDDVRRVLDQTPANRLKTFIAAAMPEMPARLQVYVNLALTFLGTVNGPLRVTTGTLAREMGVTVRTLERTCVKSKLPQPKELLSWMVLLYLTLVGWYKRMNPQKVGRRLGMSSCTMNRLRLRLLSPADREVWKTDRENGYVKFQLVFGAFLARCGVPAEGAAAAIDSIARSASVFATHDGPKRVAGRIAV